MTNITQDNLYLLLPSKVSWLAGMLSEDTGAGVVEAVRRIYNSDVGRNVVGGHRRRCGGGSSPHLQFGFIPQAGG